jgi:NAD(P)-dependent dehydrogenase (short-subunit alcohol dehydrogenase family)
VTAGGAGIGRGIARALAREGARVVVSDVDEEWGPGTIELIETAGGEAAFVRADATVKEDLRDALAFTEGRFGRLDVLVNNAGGAPRPYFPETDPDQLLWRIELNLHSAMLAAYYAIAAMKRREGGSILNVSSRAARRGGRHPRQLHLPRLGGDGTHAGAAPCDGGGGVVEARAD